MLSLTFLTIRDTLITEEVSIAVVTVGGASEIGLSTWLHSKGSLG